MKLLILSCATGEGHNSAANALIEAAQRKGCEYILADPLNFRSKNAAKIAANTYNGLIKNVPAVFGAIYGVGALYSSTGLTSPVYWPMPVTPASCAPTSRRRALTPCSVPTCSRWRPLPR